MKNLGVAILILTASFSAFAQTKTVTNADLERFRVPRVESEKRLREDYARMGFPAPEEIEKQNAQRRFRMEQYSTELSARRLQTQNDLITSANILRTRIVSIDAQINYLRGSSYNNQGFIYPYGYAPNSYRRNRSVLPQIARLPPNMRTVQEYAAMYPSSQSIYNQSIGNAPRGGAINNNRGNYRGGYFAPIIVNNGNYIQTEANQQLIYLQQTRAGLLAQWRILEEQARRAGIRID